MRNIPMREAVGARPPAEAAQERGTLPGGSLPLAGPETLGSRPERQTWSQ